MMKARDERRSRDEEGERVARKVEAEAEAETETAEEAVEAQAE